MSLSIAARKALATGEWKEHTDAATGKPYYFNKALNKTVWDLNSELSSQASPSPPAATKAAPNAASPKAATSSSANAPPSDAVVAPADKSTAASSASAVPSTTTVTTASPAPVTDFAAQAAALVQSGVWIRVAPSHELRGALVHDGVYFKHATTGETTRDLALFLEIHAAVTAPVSPSAVPPAGVTAAAAPLTASLSANGGSATTTAVSKTGESIDPDDLLDLDAWVALFLERRSSAELKDASRRLVQQVLSRSEAYQQMQDVERQFVVAADERDQLRVQLKERDAKIAEQQKELRELRRRLVFGGTDAIGCSVEETITATDGGILASGGRRAADVGGGAPGSHSSDPVRRIAELERLVASLQEVNRRLAAEVHQLSSATNVTQVKGMAPGGDDVWARLMENSVLGSRWNNNNSDYDATSAVRLLPRHLVDPLVARDKATAHSIRDTFAGPTTTTATTGTGMVGSSGGGVKHHRAVVTSPTPNERVPSSPPSFSPLPLPPPSVLTAPTALHPERLMTLGVTMHRRPAW